MSHEHGSGSLETPSWSTDVCILQVLVWWGWSYLTHFTRTYWYISHTDICEQKDMQTYELSCAHNTHSQDGIQKNTYPSLQLRFLLKVMDVKCRLFNVRIWGDPHPVTHANTFSVVHLLGYSVRSSSGGDWIVSSMTDTKGEKLFSSISTNVCGVTHLCHTKTNPPCPRSTDPLCTPDNTLMFPVEPSVCETCRFLSFSF